MKVVPYIKTIGCERFKSFINQLFVFDMLYSITETNVNVLFDEWRGRNVGEYDKFSNDDMITLEVYSDNYVIVIKPTIRHILPLPLTIGDFINDMYRYNVQLYWSEWMNENFEPKEYLDENEIKNYFIDLFTKMNKLHELS